MNFFFSLSLAYEKNTHQYAVKQAYEVLKNYFGGDIPVLLQHLGNSETGSMAFNPGNLLVIGAAREDNEDIVFGYSGLYTTCTHFWDPDMGDDSHFCTQPDNTCFENAYQKALKYLYSGPIFWPYSSAEIFYYCGPPQVITGIKFQYRSLVDFYKTGYIEILAVLTEGGSFSYFSTPCPVIVADQNDRNKVTWEILGRVCHLLADVSVPAHSHNTQHGSLLGGNTDTYELYMEDNDMEGHDNYLQWNYNNALAQGGLINVLNKTNPIKYLFYSTAQVSNHFPSDDDAGNNTNGIGDPFSNYTELTQMYTNFGDPPPGVNSQQIASSSYVFSMRAIAGLLYWFAKETNLIPIRVPQDYPTIAAALAAAVPGNTVSVSGNQILNSNLSVPTGVTLIITSGATVNLINDNNKYSIISTGGTITVESGATISGLAAKTTYYNDIKGLYSTVQSACDSTLSSGPIYTVEVQSGTYTSDIDVDGKRLSIVGQGINSTTINGEISIYNSGYIVITDLTCNYIYFGDCDDPYTRSIKINSGLSAFYSPVVDFRMNVGNSSNYACFLYGSYGSISYPSSFSGDNRAVQLSNYSYAEIDGTTFCGNTWDIYADNTSYANAGYNFYNTYSGNPPSSKFYGIVNYDPSYFICLQKSSSGIGMDNVVENEVKKNPAYDKFRKISESYFALTREVRSAISVNREFDKLKFSKDYEKAINKFKTFINSNPNSSLSKSALILTSSCYRKLDDYETMKMYLQEILGNKNLTVMSGLANRLMINYYNYQKDYNSSLTLADQILKNEKTDTDLICDVLFAKGFLYQYSLNNKEEAINIYSNMLKDYPEATIASLVKYQLKRLGVVVEDREPKTISTPEKENTFNSGNYPNPFNPSTTISYTLPEDGKVLIKVFDVLGREVTTLVNEFTTAGKHNVVWNGSNSASGIYFYSVTFRNQTLYKKMLQVK